MRAAIIKYQMPLMRMLGQVNWTRAIPSSRSGCSCSKPRKLLAVSFLRHLVLRMFTPLLTPALLFLLPALLAHR
jgi:hypothetical protein